MNTTTEYSEARGAGPDRQAPSPRALSIAVALLLLLAALCVAATLMAVLAAPLAAQAPLAASAPTLWAAQTGPNQVSLTWDSIPGTSEYLIYGQPVDSVVGNLRLRPPLQRLSGSSRSATLFGIRRLSGGITLVAMAANGHVIQKAQFNPVTPATSFAPIQPPEEVTAAATGPTEITLSWTPVPGATAYYIGRAIAPGGLGTLCMVCSAEPRYVDRDVVPGARTSYAVAAIFPNGKSRPAPSNEVTPGVTQVATTSATPTTYSKTAPGTTLNSTAPSTTSTSGTTSTTPSTTGDTTVTYSSASSYDAAHGTVTTVTTRTTCTVATPQRCWSSTTSVTSAYTPPTSTGTTTTPPTTTTSIPTSTPTSSTPTTAPDTATATPAGPIGAALNVVSNVIGTVTGAVSPPASVSAVSPAPGAVRLTWQASPTAGITEYRVSRRVNGGSWQLLATLGSSTLAYADNFFPVTLFASGPLSVTYGLVAGKSGMSSSAAVTGALSVQPPAPTTATTTTAGVSCKLDYQRADNMWAASGRPDGQLGTETISLAPGQDKVFITDWAYEKTRNDGTNYYGSHLRIATNSSTRTVRLQVRTLTVASWIRLDPGKTQQFQADLMEVFCEN